MVGGKRAEDEGSLSGRRVSGSCVTQQECYKGRDVGLPVSVLGGWYGCLGTKMPETGG